MRVNDYVTWHERVVYSRFRCKVLKDYAYRSKLQHCIIRLDEVLYVYIFIGYAILGMTVSLKAVVRLCKLMNLFIP